ncbi:MAG TPA: thioredoxin [Thermoplasmataceae archaeon]|nr:thioredoxin [Thermoplasmataceae archaeon]
MDTDKEIEAIRQRKMEEMMKMNDQNRDDKIEVESYPTKPIELTDSNFSQEIGKNSVMLVDFWAEWCGPCRMVSPIIDELAKEYAGKMTFGRLNVDENPSVAGAFQIRSIPTLLVFKDGKVVDGLLGAAPKQYIESKIQPHLN